MRVRAAGAAILFMVCGIRSVAAQALCVPPSGSNEVKLFGAFAVPIAFGPLNAPTVRRAGTVDIGLEGTYLPKLDSATRTASFCRPGKGPEHTDLLFALPRPRIDIGLPGGFLLETSWLPPVRFNGVKSNMASFALSHVTALGMSGATLGVRAHGTFGTIEGPFTCGDDALQDPASECYQGTRSNDRYRPNIFGVETTGGLSLAGGRFRPYAGAGVNWLRPRFQVEFINSLGALDNTRVEANLTRFALFGGASWAAAPGLAISGEIYAQPADAVTPRIAVRYRL